MLAIMPASPARIVVVMVFAELAGRGGVRVMGVTIGPRQRPGPDIQTHSGRTSC